MVFLTLDDPTGSAEVVVFTATYAASRELCVTDRILVVKGRVDHKQQGETKLIALELTAFEAVSERREVRFRLDARAGTGRRDPRSSPVSSRSSRASRRSSCRSRRPKARERCALGPRYRVQPDSDFIAEAKALLGEASVA